MKLHSTIAFIPKPLVGLPALFTAAFLLVPPLSAEQGSSQTHTSALYFIDADDVRLWDISLDGSTVVGHFNNAEGNREGFVWSIDGGFLPLGSLGGTHRYMSSANAVSADGSVVVGWAKTAEQVIGRGRNRTVIPSRDEAFIWTAETGMVSLGSLGGDSAAYGVSADGTVVAGHGRNSDDVFEPFRWTMDSGMVGLGTLGGGTRVYTGSGGGGSPLSADGSTITGRGYDGTNHTAFVWTLDGGMQTVPTVVNLPYLSWDGTVAAGYTGAETSVDEAYVWTDVTGPFGLGMIGDTVRSEPLGITADGGMVVGWSHSGWSNDALPDEAFIWDWFDDLRTLPKPAEEISAGAWGISSEASVIAGGLFPGVWDFNEEPVVWLHHVAPDTSDDFYELHFVRDILNDGGVDLVDVLDAWGIFHISGDGNVLAGYTYEDGGYGVPFVAVLDVAALGEPGDDEPGDDEPGDDEPGDDGDTSKLVANVSWVDVGPRGRHMDVIASIADADGTGVSGALVDIAVEHLSSDQVYFESGTTGSDGTVSWRYSNANASDYEAEVLDVRHPDYD